MKDRTTNPNEEGIVMDEFTGPDLKSKPQTYQIEDLGNLPAALQPLTAEKRWICWRWEPKAEKPDELTKEPKVPWPTHYNASSTDPKTWGHL
jgi:hypothetical protein